jgi:protein TonB
MNHTCLLTAAFVLSIGAASELSAQTSSSGSKPAPATTTPATTPSAPTTPVTATPASTETEYEMFEFTEDQLPRYDERELIALIHYPDLARANGLEGTAVIMFVVDKSGHAIRLEAVQSDNPLFTEAAIDAIRQLHFTPATHEGKPVLVRMTLPVRFALTN